MRTETLPPDPQLFESMRAVGYNLHTALADVIDNSISAEATEIDIRFDGEAPEPYVYVLDNGRGMSLDVAKTAMRLAGTNTSETRTANDLGRFGLGLKTASLSQCRRLTLVSKIESRIVALRWDLVYLAETRSWDLLILDDAEITGLPGVADLSQLDHGTLVLWQDLDRLAAQTAKVSQLLDSQMVDASAHLSLVFHRFLAGDGYPRVDMTLNLVPVEGADPFLLKSRRTQPSPVEIVDLGDAKIAIQAFTLPFVSKMSANERKRATANGDLRDSQGFYIYRAGRLVVWGTWFRLIARADMSKLTRVKVDIPNSLDSLWSLDIKKSSAVPPNIVRERLAILATNFVQPSERAHNYRGRKSSSLDEVVRAWEVLEERDSARYVLNLDHPSMSALSSSLEPAQLTLLNDAIRVLESTLPLQDIYNRMSKDSVEIEPAAAPALLEQWRSAFVHLWSLTNADESVDGFLDRMLSSEPFTMLAANREQIKIELMTYGS